MLGSLAISRREERAAFYTTPRPAESTRGISNFKQFKQPETCGSQMFVRVQQM